MTRARLSALALLAVLACQSKLFTISVADEAETIVEKGTILETLLADMGFGEFVSMDITSAEELANQGVAPGDIQDVRLVLFELEVTSPAGGDLSFLDSLDVIVEAPGLPAETVAFSDSFPPGVSTVAFELTDLDLTPYVVSESMTLTTEVSGRRPDQDTAIVARFELDVGVTGQGACNAGGA